MKMNAAKMRSTLCSCGPLEAHRAVRLCGVMKLIPPESDGNDNAAQGWQPAVSSKRPCDICVGSRRLNYISEIDVRLALCSIRWHGLEYRLQLNVSGT